MSFKITKKEIERLYEIVNEYDSPRFELIQTPTGIGPILSVRILTVEDTELKIVSINPVDIIGAKQLVIYNTKTHILGIYYSKDKEGLSIKGTTLINFDPLLSTGKRIKQLPIVGTQRVPNTNYKSLIENQKTKPHLLTGRINSDTMLLTIGK